MNRKASLITFTILTVIIGGLLIYHSTNEQTQQKPPSYVMTGTVAIVEPTRFMLVEKMTLRELQTLTQEALIKKHNAIWIRTAGENIQPPKPTLQVGDHLTVWFHNINHTLPAQADLTKLQKH
ncbi:DUF3221 domain-containing protein [Caldalkalibacillus salinus]|uniref:DUF3221 domain-containing protein n=1 Tax=Caldalkalibacillus salinus TaxID=2803787 RepID=UPI001923A553|nr:DUF3221 domain-containing protein [Caldalkalibacillus salinus]